MNNRVLLTFGLAVVVVLAVIGAVFFVQRGAHVVLEGRVLKVRTAPLDERTSVLVADFRCTNVSDYVFTVHDVKVSLVDEKGISVEGMVIAEIDARRLFEGIPLLGQKYNDSLLVRDKIPAHASQDRMIAAKFDVTEAQLEHRKGLTVRIEEADGAISEILGK